jgi:hypothetical protein
MKDMTEGKLEEQLQFAASINDNSLKDCLMRMFAVESRQKVEHHIYPDWAKRSFAFGRYREDGTLALNGGIIYHGSPNEGYQEGGSVQIEPSYGWQTHT